MNPDSVTRDSSDQGSDHVRFADWDAAYVLGALSPTERREFEAHLETCARCRAAVAELTSMPGLLGRVSPEDALALLGDEQLGGVDARDGNGAAPRPDLVERVREEDRRRRRTVRIRWIGGLAAAAALIAAVALPLALTRPTTPPTQNVALEQVVESPLVANIGLVTMGWGTKLEVDCSYAKGVAPDNPDAEWAFALWVTDDEGNESQVSSWTAKQGWDVKLDAATSVQSADIRSIDIRSLDTGEILLQKSI